VTCSTRGCPYPAAEDGLCRSHRDRLGAYGDPVSGTCTVEEHDAWCHSQGLEIEDIAREERVGTQRLEPWEIKLIRGLYEYYGNQNEVQRQTSYSCDTIQRYTKDLKEEWR